ncbi:MAG: hypothetical protein ABEI74_05050 [Candidatus Pacearchaeota archaeon]
MKKALLVEGKPGLFEDPEKFYEDNRRNMSIMEQVLSDQNYEAIKEVPLERMIPELKKSKDYEELFFYYTGHSNSTNLGDIKYEKKDIFRCLEGQNRKYVVFDSCSNPGSYHENSLNTDQIPNNSSVFWANEVFPNKSIAKSFYDAIIARKYNFKDLSEKVFEEMNHGWINLTRRPLNDQKLY